MYKKFISTAIWHRSTGKEYYESINAAAKYLSNSLVIVPKYNMISNIGVGGESTYNTDDVRLLSKKVRRLMHMKTYEIDFPLIHPQKIERDFAYKKASFY